MGAKILTAFNLASDESCDHSL